ncbi:AGAP006262-PA-like protein [Anopheles sinensis]|uniref:AGAP006262-PA-like protein n=1 Tax=Anopheles sinensis TaxID=74873 RepID=A0A084WKH4_ANOSI|nr:AGAP006262-PA-like protein [Anopheles sinensis]
MAVPSNRIPCAVLLCALAELACLGAVTGSYLRDVELIAPSPQVDFNTVYYYPSYVKGEDPVEEFNRRRLHVDTAMFMDDDVRPAKRKRKTFPTAIARRNPKLRAQAPNRVGVEPSDHERNYLKIRQSSGVPRYIRDDVEIFDIKQHAGKKITKATDRAKEPRSRRAPRTVAMETSEDPRRYEESDPQIFAYERSDSPEVIARTNPRRTEDGSEDSKYFQFVEVFGDGSHVASSRRGNDRHYVEQFERGSHDAGVFQKKVKWADKQGGFGEHYWDLNHIQATEPHDG